MCSRWLRPLSDGDALGILVGIRLEHDAVDDAEDGGVDADAEGQAGDRDGGERRALGERAPGVAHILKEHRDLDGPRGRGSSASDGATADPLTADAGRQLRRRRFRQRVRGERNEQIRNQDAGARAGLRIGPVGRLGLGAGERAAEQRRLVQPGSLGPRPRGRLRGPRVHCRGNRRHARGFRDERRDHRRRRVARRRAHPRQGRGDRGNRAARQGDRRRGPAEADARAGPGRRSAQPAESRGLVGQLPASACRARSTCRSEPATAASPSARSSPRSRSGPATAGSS